MGVRRSPFFPYPYPKKYKEDRKISRSVFQLMMLFLMFNLQSQTTVESREPKLVVGIVIDQMRAEYLYRFANNYGEDGFKRLLRSGFNVKNMHYNYVPTATGPGHASIFTGTTPSDHGIIANRWYDRETNNMVYCVDDKEVRTLPLDGKNGIQAIVGSSPKKLECTTITDELKLFSNNRSKVFGISLKNRGAVLPAGHLADNAFWYAASTGDFVTSSFYDRPFPEWLTKFNKLKKADSLLNLTWRPLLDISEYTNSEVDDSGLERIYKGKTKSSFPYDLKTLRKENGGYDLLPRTPFGNSLLTHLALACLKGERLGKSEELDFLSISYSSTDYVGHQFGIRSKELEDTYVRMDREIASLLKGLDTHLGKNNYILFLTSDHAASDHPQYLERMGLPGNEFSTKSIRNGLEQELVKKFGGKEYIAHIDMNQIYFNETSDKKEEVIDFSLRYLDTIQGIQYLYSRRKPKAILHDGISNTLARSIHDENSGDIVMMYKAGWMEERNFGTTHGTRYNSDTHVPLLWFGKTIKSGETAKMHTITQIAPTLALMLNIPLPNASAKQPILGVVKEFSINSDKLIGESEPND